MVIARAALQEIVPNQMRAQTVAVQLLLLNLVGTTLGPLFVALVTDYGFGDDGALRYSLAITLPLMLAVAGLLMARGLSSFRATKDALAADSP